METAALTAAFEKYPAYKDSGIEWLGEIPAHWEKLPLCSISLLKSLTNYIGLELLSVYLELGVIKFNDIEAKRTNVTSHDLTKYQRVDVGDLVLNNQQAWRGSVGVSNFTGIVSPAYLVLEINNKINKNFANYMFRSGYMVAQYLINSKGVGTIQRNLYWPSLRRSLVVVPPLPEQTAIAQFLDDKTAKIDRAIAQKEKLITLLKERKQIIIQELVTGKKVWNPAQNAFTAPTRVKPSGVEWIGEIPEHWAIEKGKWLYVEQKRAVRKEDEIITCFRDGQVTLRTNRKTEGFTNALKEHGYQGIRVGDLVIHNMDAFAGAIGVSDSDGKSTPVYSVCTERKSGIVNSYYYAYLLRELARKGFIQALAKGIRERSTDFRFSDFANLEYAVPPLVEQNAIVEQIQQQSSKIDKAINSQERQIEKLKELKSSLIDAAVTGKIKVG